MTVTSGKAWRARTEEVTLPSGNTAELRKPDVLSLVMRNGGIPDVLTAQVMAGLQDEGGKSPKFGAKELGQLLEMLNTVTRACFVSPRIVDKPEEELAEDELRVEDVSMEDKSFIFQWAAGSGDGAAVSSFLAQQAARLDALSPRADVGTDAVGDAGDS